ncbi:MAG TPA: UDP-glucose/GDP-mannose dehydrogenase family protein [Ignavibacteriaceae bacterium]|nr:UDP-glucose/GDP-mannose dehydrogenase family protein [Ignavibacteriaceae bacterium]
MNIAVVGTGYVGLVTGTCFAETGNTVYCVDIDAEKIKKLKKGVVPIYEPGLDILIERNIKVGRLKFTTVLADAVKESNLIFLCLPTPQDDDGSADLQYVLKVADDLGKMFRSDPGLGFKVIINKSTVPVGTSEKVKNAIKKHSPGYEFDVASNPEFLREGMAVDDFMKPERVVVGTSSPKTKDMMEQLYEPFVRSGNPIYFMDEKSAEVTKYAANSFLATKISFMNEIANLCEITGAEVDKVRIGVGSDSRIGKRFLFPGVGYGGSCFPKDVIALINTAKENKYDFKILKSVYDINKNQIIRFFKKIENHYSKDLEGKTFTVWGLAFKPNTDDVREAPAIRLIEKLLESKVKVKAYDPAAMETGRRILKDKIEFCETPYDALENSDALIIVTEWNEFRTPDYQKIKKMLKKPVIFDGRNLYDLSKMEEMGFTYYSIGRKAVISKQ